MECPCRCTERLCRYLRSRWGNVFHYRLRVRADECDSLGHMNNAIYIRHSQQATLDTLGAVDADYTSWNVRTLAVEYHAPARYGDVRQTFGVY